MQFGNPFLVIVGIRHALLHKREGKGMWNPFDVLGQFHMQMNVVEFFLGRGSRIKTGNHSFKREGYS